MSSTIAPVGADFGSTASLDVRLANLATTRGPAVGAEIDRGVLDVTATGASLGLEAPPLFSKVTNALNGDSGRIHLPTRVARYFDYETELVVVFGRECRDVPEKNALDVVAGYATGNDFSARDLQTVTTQFLAGKASDGFAPIGPWLVPASRVADPNQLRLTTTVNGETRQDWCTDDMIFNVRQLISYITGIFTVQPGDILFTGTPQGVVLGHPGPMADRAWLRAGNHVVSEVEGLGALHITLLDDAA